MKIQLKIAKEKANLNIKIDKKLKEKVAAILKADSNAKRKIGWTELVEACFYQFLDEHK